MTCGNCYIVGAGERIKILPVPEQGDLLIAADGGYAWLKDKGLEPDLVVGDFDSMAEPAGVAPLVRLPRMKDDTDTMAAVRLGQDRGYRQFHIFGGTGGRFDHTLANLQLLAWLSRRGEQGWLYGPDWTATAITAGALEFGPENRGMISVFAHSDRARGVTIEGLKYSLAGAELDNGFSLGVSNEFTGVPSRVSVEEGTLLVVWERREICL
ncbi:thiamine diphosphokinase [uncultured Pseudoflavonifractor sp.]|uniref:thiamine diphosphokinase n=1 Tax=uncultured Pseudoflavonifractor sp. TaxID=1221379 RepID=UPI0025D2544F|nr:thiamine diphosphokinase [uncultured Pseudoflavonifractor sp.]